MRLYFNIYSLLPAFILMGVMGFQYYKLGEYPETLDILPPKLPSAPAVLSEQSLEQMLLYNLWDKNRGRITAEKFGGEAEGDDKPVQWRLLAIAEFKGDSKKVAMVEVKVGETKSLTTFSAGDFLPDTSQILEVMNDGLVVESEGKRKNVYLFGKK